MSKQDRQGVRTPADIERKYNLGDLGKQNVQQAEKISRLMQSLVQCESQINNLVEKFNNIYPVGSIYISANDTEPSTLFGGSWKLIKQGYLLVGLDQESEELPTELEFLDKCNVWKRIEDVTVAVLDEAVLDETTLS